mmetsp:Transcript_25632/g.59720  ORF Transcript_25632/g.59720 Transcript_25632/m.59720 type:complete len:197 (+) Transcript_25632:29-619(+)
MTEQAANEPAAAPPQEEDADDAESDSESSWEEDPGEEDRKLIICVRNDLNMSAGKVGAQVGHAVHKCVTVSRWRDIRAWESVGSKKITLKVDSEQELHNLKEAARAQGLVAHSIRDAGHTEVEPGTTTVLGIGPALAREVDPITGHLRPLPNRIKDLERENTKLKEKAERLQKELDEAKGVQKRLLTLLRASSSCI